MTSTRLPELSNRLLAFGDDTKAVALTIAVRSALRTIPLLERLAWEKPLRKRMRAGLGRERMSNSAIVLGTFRSAATAWVAARFHSFGMSDRFHEIKDHARLSGGAEDAGKTAAAMAAAATHYAMMVAIAAFSHRPPQSEVDESQHREDAALYANHTATVAAVGFMEAYDPQSAKKFHASRDPNWLANRELCASERAIWD